MSWTFEDLATKLAGNERHNIYHHLPNLRIALSLLPFGDLYPLHFLQMLSIFSPIVQLIDLRSNVRMRVFDTRRQQYALPSELISSCVARLGHVPFASTTRYPGRAAG